MVNRDLFLHERTRGIGGSDAASLLSHRVDVRYGCRRRLWYRLSGATPDYSQPESELMTLGNILEPVIARAYADATGRQVHEVGLKRHDDHPSIQVHVDRIIDPAADDERRTQGVLEIKAVGSEMARQVHDEGVILDHILQLNHGMLCHGLTWGSFAVGTREDLLPLVVIEQAAVLSGEPIPKMPRSPRIMHFDLERDSSICAAIEEEAPKFWATLNNESQSPERLEPDDNRCQQCQFKVQCQGAALMAGADPEHSIEQRPDLAPLVEEYRENMAALDQSQAAVDATEKKFKEALGRKTAARVLVDDKWKNVIYRIRDGAKRIDGRAMALQYDAVRRAAISAGLLGAELIPPSANFARTSGPSRPLLLRALLPPKDKPVDELDDAYTYIPDF